MAAARQLPLHDAAAYELLGHAAPITTLVTHPSVPLAITIDSEGAGLLWTTTVLAPTARLPFAEVMTQIIWDLSSNGDVGDRHVGTEGQVPICFWLFRILLYCILELSQETGHV